jgi:ESS family glutamate:Na+ symporter
MQYFLLTVFLLGAGAWLGQSSRALTRLRIPPSLYTGMALLLFFTVLPAAKDGLFFAHLKSLPSEFIALVFACFFLRKSEHETRARHGLLHVTAQMSYVWVAVMGQVLLALIATLFIIKPLWNFPLAFAALLETGFAGGHGTAVAMGPLLVQNGIEAGLELGLASATIGLVCGIAGGIFFARRMTNLSGPTAPQQSETDSARLDLNSLLVSLALIAAAYGVGVLIKGIVEQEVLPRVALAESLKNFSLPLFAYTLVGGITVKLICRFSGQERHIDNDAIMLLGDFFLEVLIFAGIAIIDVRLLATGLIPLLILAALGFAWNLYCFLHLRKHMLPMQYGQELALMNFGMLNGTSAIGLMLAKMVDPHFKTPAVRVFAESSALTQPFIAGGLLTLLTPYLVMHSAPLVSIALFAALLVFWLVFGLATARRLRQQPIIPTAAEKP